MQFNRENIKQLAIVATGYCLLAQVGYALTVPPGLASAIWPAAGLSAAFTLLMGPHVALGVFLGSVAGSIINLGIANLHWIHFVIGLAAACQSLVFWNLLYRFTVYPDFDDLRTIRNFIFVGSVSAIASSVIGVTGLMAAGFTTSVFFDWATWWFGDTMGVIIFAPLILLFIGPPEIWNSRRQPLIAACLTTFILFVAILFHINSREKEVSQFELALQTTMAIDSVNKNIFLAREASMMLEAFHRGTPVTTPQNFKNAAKAAKSGSQSIRAIEWIPRVSQGNKNLFEQTMSKTLGRPYNIFDSKIETPGNTTTELHDYFPVGYIEPLDGNESALGFNLASEPIRAAAIRRSIETGSPVTTPPVKIVQAKESRFGGILYFIPAKPINSATEVSELFLSIVDLDILLAPFMALTTSNNIQFIIREAGSDSVIGSSFDNLDKSYLQSYERNATSTNKSIEFAGQSWKVQFLKGRHSSNHNIYNWMILGLSLVLCGGTITGVLLYTGNVRRTDALISARTHELAATRDEALRAANAKSDFLATMSHEIRTPMNGIIGMTETLAESELNDEQRFAVKVIQESGGALLSLLNNILDMSKIEAGKIELSNVKFNPQRMLIGVKGLFAPIAKIGKTKFELEVDPSVPDSVFGDDVRIRQILINIVSNALKFSEGASVKIRAKATLDGPSATLLFDIVDTGQGMNEAQLARIFKPFSQGDAGTTRRFGGTGLGLSIAQNLARLMGGDITVDSDFGRGTTFHITVNVHRGQEIENPIPIVVIQPTPGADFSEISVLVAEDNPTNQVVINQFLSKLHVKPVMAKNGLEAVNLVSERNWDVIFMDLHMPELDGMGAVIKIRSLGTKVKQPWIIALTADAYETTQKECYAVGMNDFITKPVTKNSLSDALSKVKVSKS